MDIAEYVGELRAFLPDKNISLVHGGTELMNKTYPSKFRKALFNAVTKKGVQVILGDKIAPTVVPEGGYVTTEGGKRIQADIVVSCFGPLRLRCDTNNLHFRSMLPVAVPIVSTWFLVAVERLLTRAFTSLDCPHARPIRSCRNWKHPSHPRASRPPPIRCSKRLGSRRHYRMA